MLFAAVLFGCGKTETAHKTPERTAAGTGAEKSGGLLDNFPGDVPIFKGAKQKGAISQGERMIVQLYTPATISEVANFYDREFKARGWTIEKTSEAGDLVVSARKGKTLCSVTIVRQGKETLIRLSLLPAS